ncbi:MAG: hypothetical protein M1812_003714 [Candelaria pacifica]|nr:MAG: hypothetical protein M1812_003714 [Candelaria pacifica]
MDGVSSAASGIAVASLAIQLAENVKKLYEFWQSVKDAPDDVRTCVGDLRLLSAALDNVASRESIQGPNLIVTEILNNCVGKIKILSGIVESFEAGFASTKARVRKWSAFKAALKIEKIRKFRIALQEVKITLILARQYSSDSQHEYYSETLTAIAESLSNIQTQGSSARKAMVADLADHVDVLSSEIRHHHAETSSNREELQHNIEFLTRGLANLHVQQSYRITTITADLQDLGAHITDLRGEIQRMAEMIPNPIFRSGFVSTMSSALQEAISRSNLHASISLTETSSRPEDPPDIKNHYINEEQISEVSLVASRKCLGVSPSIYSSKKRERQRVLVDTKSFESKNVLGSVTLHSATYRVAFPPSDGSDMVAGLRKNQFEVETFFVLHPAPWLARWGMKYGVRATVLRSTKGWQNNLKHFRVVPNQSLIFDLCEEGNTAGVRTLFLRGEASPLDTDLGGRTPLHFAAYHCNSQLCEFLLDAGGDPCARTYKSAPRSVGLGSSPVKFACTDLYLAGRQDRARDHESLIATLRVFSKTVDFIEEIANNQLDLHELLIRDSRVVPDSNAVSEWVLLQFKEEIRENSHAMDIRGMLDYASGFRKLERPMQLLLDSFNHRLNEPDVCKGLNLHASILHEGFTEYNSPTLQLYGQIADLHYPFPTSGSTLPGQGVTSTTLAIRDPYTFQRWKYFLQRVLKSDISEFLQREFQETPLSKAGWTRDTLLTLFQYDLDAEFEREDKGPKNCSRCDESRVYREAWWDLAMDNIKHRQEPHESQVDSDESAFPDVISELDPCYVEYGHRGWHPVVYELCAHCLWVTGFPAHRQGTDGYFRKAIEGMRLGEEIQNEKTQNADEQAGGFPSTSSIEERTDRNMINPTVDLVMMWA